MIATLQSRARPRHPAGRAEYAARARARRPRLCARARADRRRRAAAPAHRRSHPARRLSGHARQGGRRAAAGEPSTLKPDHHHPRQTRRGAPQMYRTVTAATALRGARRVRAGSGSRTGPSARIPALGRRARSRRSRRPTTIAAQIAVDEINAAGGVERQEAPHRLVRHRRQAGSGGGRPAQARRGRQGAGDHRAVQLERMPRGISGRRPCRHCDHVDGLVGAEAGGAVHLRVPQHVGRGLHVRARDARRSRRRASRTPPRPSPTRPTT